MGPALLDLEKVTHLEYLLKARENLLYTELRKKMASALVYTKVGKKMPGILKPIGDKLQEKGIFNTWMLQEQDLIQAFAKAYLTGLCARRSGRRLLANSD